MNISDFKGPVIRINLITLKDVPLNLKIHFDAFDQGRDGFLIFKSSYVNVYKYKNKVRKKLGEAGLILTKEDIDREIRNHIILLGVEDLNLVTVREVHPDKQLIVMDYGGIPMKIILSSIEVNDQFVATFTTQIINGLSKLNSIGVIHRDLDFRNIVCDFLNPKIAYPEQHLKTPDNFVLIFKICDYGACSTSMYGGARSFRQETTKQAPESSMSIASDVYSVGRMMNHLMKGSIRADLNEEQLEIEKRSRFPMTYQLMSNMISIDVDKRPTYDQILKTLLTDGEINQIAFSTKLNDPEYIDVSGDV